MKKMLSCLVVFVLVVLGAVSSPAGEDVKNNFILRGGFHGSTPTHLAEWYQERGTWIITDVGYVDFGESKTYREFFVGAGRTFLKFNEKLVLVPELYFVQATGPDARGATYLQPYILAIVELNKKFTVEANWFVYVPLNKSGYAQSVLDHARLEYAPREWLKLGVGYAHYVSTRETITHKPTATAIFITKRFGSIEFSPQLLIGKDTTKTGLQVRYALRR